MANNPALFTYINNVLSVGVVGLLAERDEHIRKLERRIDVMERVFQWQRRQRAITGKPVTISDMYFAAKLEQWAGGDTRSPAPEQSRDSFTAFALLGDGIERSK